MNDWVTHVKCYQAEHNCSYKDAMSGAKSSYKKGSTAVEGGKFNLSKAVKKITKGAKRGSKLVEQHKDLAKLVAPQYADQIDKVSKASNKVNQFANLVDTQTGSGFNLKKAVRKATKGTKRAAKGLEKNKQLINLVTGDKYSDQIDKASRQMGKAVRIADAVDGVVDGAGIKHFGRKLKHSVHKGAKIAKKVSRAVDQYGPMLEVLAPELAPVIALNSSLRGGAIGSTRNGRQNPYMTAGSFTVPHHGGSFHAGAVPSNSSLISVHHPAFHPKQLKSYRELIVNN
jgi:hypothetical protein